MNSLDLHPESPPRYSKVAAVNMTDDLKYPMMCSRWHRCSVNCCPLDPGAKVRRSISGDPERTCKEHLRHRLEVAALAGAEGVKLAWGGMSLAEHESGVSLGSMLAEWDRRLEAKKASGKRLQGGRNPVQGR